MTPNFDATSPWLRSRSGKFVEPLCPERLRPPGRAGSVPRARVCWRHHLNANTP